MRSFLLARIIGLLLIFVAGSLVLPLIVSLIYQDGDAMAFVWSIVVTIIVAAALYLPSRGKAHEINHREGFAIVTLGWVSACLAGALPFYLTGTFDNFTFCLFESTSGFTTTGASVLSNIEALPHGVLFWRSLTHWMGGMGIILLSVAILPLLGVGGMELYRAEVPGTVLPDRLSPRISETARILWWVYVLISAAEIILLWIGGMPLFDSLCHTFGTMATGGFSTKNASIGHYGSVYIQVVVTFFMFLAGVNFFLHYQMLSGRPRVYLKDPEFRFYITIIIGGILLFTILLTREGVYQNIFKSLQFASFQVLAILTTTGYTTADFEKWPYLTQIILVLFMFIGGMGGSTGGGMKCLRILIVIKAAYRELFRLIHPRAVTPLRLGKRTVPDKAVNGVLGFFCLFLGLFVIASLALCLLGLDLTTSLCAVIACIGNIGPGLGAVGPTDNYSSIPLVGKWILIFCMLLGRLEIYTVIIMLVPEFWRK
jgi:trk system potassium uptake protein TrkH